MTPRRIRTGQRSRGRIDRVGLLLAGASLAFAQSTAVADVANVSGESPSTLFAVDPVREIDTRVISEFGRGVPVPAGETLRLNLDVPTSALIEPTAVVLNVSAVEPAGPGHLTVHRCASPRPEASSLNFRPGVTTGNLVVVGRDAPWTCVYASTTTHVVVDVLAWVGEGGSPLPVEPARLLETRAGHDTIDGQFAAIGSRPAGSTLELQVAGRGGVPVDAAAALLNLTAVGADADGHVTLHPCDEPRPVASSLNHPADSVTGNASVARLDADGRVCIYTRARTHLVVDVAAHVPADADPAPVGPVRLLETRTGFTTVDGVAEAIGRREAGSTTEVQITGRAGIPEDAVAVTFSLTAVGPSDPGFVTVHRCDVERPETSNLNYRPGRVTGNAGLAKLDAGGRLCVFTRSESDFVIDVTGVVRSHVPALEREALRTVYDETDGDDWTRNEGWRTASDPCDWQGVTCDGNGVRYLDLSSNSIAGTLPGAIGDLANLEVLTLDDNALTALPSEIGGLGSLERLFIHDNALTALPPEIGDLSRLERFRLENNQLTTLPTEIGNLGRIRSLDAQANRLSSLPAGIGGLDDIDVLDLSSNELTSLPPEIGDVTGGRLDLADNQLANLPPEIGGIADLGSLIVSGNRLVALPPEIGLLDVTRLDLSNNLLTTLPIELGDIGPSLTTLRLEDNDLGGDLTAVFASVRANSPLITSLAISGRGCPTITVQAVIDWLDDLHTNEQQPWDVGCP